MVVYKVENTSASLWTVTRGHAKVGFARKVAEGYFAKVDGNTATHSKLFGALNAAAPDEVDLIMESTTSQEQNPVANPKQVAALEAFLNEGNRRAKQSGRTLGRWPQMLARWGAVEAVSRAVLNSPIPRKVAEDPLLVGYLLEDAVIRFADLFSNAVRQRAQQRLDMLSAA